VQRLAQLLVARLATAAAPGQPFPQVRGEALGHPADHTGEAIGIARNFFIGWTTGYDARCVDL
jgi:hypothetical protein